MVGPGSGEPMARKGRAGRPALLFHNWSKVRGALGADVGSWAMSSMEAALESQGRAVKAGKRPEKVYVTVLIPDRKDMF